ncbi:hypothetical protein CCR75_005847 [Bremia lactucae]|uniref:Centrosomin N-terminal motif 1 domain-containing protein n=1 Tax=Bremia lactucae TaxID=4779 RepID=A0A976FGJ5_BRELC|nr:hypothetical protein CCR75_005847 [Bremia lactucae]
MQTPQRDRSEGDSGGGTLMKPSRDHSTLLREQEAERERLRMDNFNQALRINFLEERLLRMKQGTDFSSEDLESELAQLRIALEERDHELRQRNFSMIRATEAIDMLTAQLHEAQAAAAQAKDEAQREADVQLHQMIKERGGIDAKTAEKWRAELDSALQREQQSHVKAHELEHALQKQRETENILKLQYQALQESQSTSLSEMERRLQQIQQQMQQAELAKVKATTEAEHWQVMSSQRDEQMAVLQSQMETIKQDKQALDARYQAKCKRMEQQVQHQMEKLQRESENYRAEHTRLLTDREKAQFDKTRLLMEIESVKQDCLRLQGEIERLRNERQEIAGDSERLRLQNVKLCAACEEQAKTLETFQNDRETALDTIHQLESKLLEYRKVETEHHLIVQTLESRLEHAEAEGRRVLQQYEEVESRCQETFNERLGALENDRHLIEEDNRRLQAELMAFQLNLETMERKVQDSEKRIVDETMNAQEQRQRLLTYEEELEKRCGQIQAYQDQLAGCEKELSRRAAHVQKLEQQMADAASTSSLAALEHQRQRKEQFAMEKKTLIRQIDEERRQAIEAERVASSLKEQHVAAQRELESVRVELYSHMASRNPVLNDNRPLSAVSLVQETVAVLKDEFKTKSRALQTRWKQQTLLMTTKLERLSSQLRASEEKLKALERSMLCAKELNQITDETWVREKEELRVEREKERRSLEDDIQNFRSQAAEAQEALSHALSDLNTLKQSQKDSDRDYGDLKESNRLLFEEVNERRRSIKHARKQFKKAIQENTELLKAIEMYKDAIAGRDKDIDKLKSTVMKYAQQLQRRVEFKEVKQTLLEQLEQTQYMITETYKRWENSPILVSSQGKDPKYKAAILQLDDYIGRMHLVSGRKVRDLENEIQKAQN